MTAAITLPSVVWLHDPFNVQEQQFLIHGLIEPETLVVQYGEPNCGKSTLAVDIGMAVARGAPWRDRATVQGLTLHIAAEGARGVRMRQAAYIRHHKVPRTLPYAVLPVAVDLGTTGFVRAMVAHVLEAAAGIGQPPALVIVDTLARCLLGDENTGVDMGRFIAGCDAIRTETKAAVMVIHHSGKDVTKGARGHSSLRAAADTELLCDGGQNPRSLRVMKQRDMEVAEPMGFRLEPVTIGTDPATDTAITAVVVEHDDTATIRKPKATGKNQQRAVTALTEWCRANDAGHISSIDISGLLRAQSINRFRQREVLEHLVNVRAITPAVGGYTVDRGML